MSLLTRCWAAGTVARTTSARAIRLTVVVALAGLLLAGIGLAGAGAASGATSATPRQKYISKLDPLCRKWDAKVLLNKAPSNVEPNASGSARYRAWGKRFYALWGKYDKAVTAVPPPPSAASFVSSWTAMRKAVQELAKQAQSLGPLVFISPYGKRVVQADKNFALAAARYGFHDCGVPYRKG